MKVTKKVKSIQIFKQPVDSAIQVFRTFEISNVHDHFVIFCHK